VTFKELLLLTPYRWRTLDNVQRRLMLATAKRWQKRINEAVSFMEKNPPKGLATPFPLPKE
jgi:hypothetical protein